jgi:hypothetical protein
MGFDIFSHRSNIATFFTLLLVGVSFAWLGVEDPSQWRAGLALYIIGSKHRGLCLAVSSERIYLSLQC